MRTLEQLRTEYPLTALTCLTEDGLKRIAGDIDKYFSRWGYEDGLEYNEAHGSLDITAKLHSEWHTEDGGDHYMGIWEQVGVLDSTKVEVELYDEDGERCTEAERELEKFLN